MEAKDSPYIAIFLTPSCYGQTDILSVYHSDYLSVLWHFHAFANIL
jgi:hypothetical protein